MQQYVNPIGPTIEIQQNIIYMGKQQHNRITPSLVVGGNAHSYRRDVSPKIFIIFFARLFSVFQNFLICFVSKYDAFYDRGSPFPLKYFLDDGVP